MKKIQSKVNKKEKSWREQGRQRQIPRNTGRTPFAGEVGLTEELCRDKHEDIHSSKQGHFGKRDISVTPHGCAAYSNKKSSLWKQILCYWVPVSVVYLVEVSLAANFLYMSLLNGHGPSMSLYMAIMVGMLTLGFFLAIKFLMSKAPNRQVLNTLYGCTTAICIICFIVMFRDVVEARLDIQGISKSASFAYASCILAGLIPILWAWAYWGCANAVALYEEIFQAQKRYFETKLYLVELEQKNHPDHVKRVCLDGAEENSANTEPELEDYRRRLDSHFGEESSNEENNFNNYHKESDDDHPELQ